MFLSFRLVYGRHWFATRLSWSHFNYVFLFSVFFVHFFIAGLVMPRKKTRSAVHSACKSKHSSSSPSRCMPCHMEFWAAVFAACTRARAHTLHSATSYVLSTTTTNRREQNLFRWASRITRIYNKLEYIELLCEHNIETQNKDPIAQSIVVDS